VTGTVISWNASKKFGWIRLDKGPRDLFAHAADLVGVEELRRGQAVSFVVVDAGRGPRAVDVRVLEPASLEGARS
jgi:cold shock CspA family protein